MAPGGESAVNFPLGLFEVLRLLGDDRLQSVDPLTIRVWVAACRPAESRNGCKSAATVRSASVGDCEAPPASRAAASGRSGGRVLRTVPAGRCKGASFISVCRH